MISRKRITYKVQIERAPVHRWTLANVRWFDKMISSNQVEHGRWNENT